MNILESYFFKHFYEPSFAKRKRAKPFTDIQRLADVIFHDRGFIDWLKIKYKKKLTEKSYPNYRTAKNFQEYVASYNKIKNKKEVSLKRKIIEEQLELAEKFPPIKKYEYDIDIVEAYFKLEKMLETVVYDSRFRKKDEYLDGILHLIRDYCKKKNLPVEEVLKHKYPIIIDSTMDLFQAYLGITLISFDINKIDDILSYQNILWKGEGLFASFVEHGVYSYVIHNSPFDNNIRLNAIMNWVRTKREFVPTDGQGNVINQNSAFNAGTKENVKLQWKPHISLKQQKELSRDLKIRGYTKSLNDFQKVFTDQKIINWLKEPGFLVYMLYRLHGEYGAIKVYKRGYFKAAQVLFNNCIDTVVTKFKDGELKELNHNITTRDADKYLKLRNRVDYLLQQIFKK